MLTSYTGKELMCEVLNLAIWERQKPVVFEEVIYTLAKEVRDDADMAVIVEAVSKMDAAF